MGFFMEPDPPPLTEQDKLLAALIAVNQRVPLGFQIGMPMRIERALKEVRELFTERDLPLREEIVAELSVWRTHAQEGLAFGERCDQLIRTVIRQVDGGHWRPGSGQGS